MWVERASTFSHKQPRGDGNSVCSEGTRSWGSTSGDAPSVHLKFPCRLAGLSQALLGTWGPLLSPPLRARWAGMGATEQANVASPCVHPAPLTSPPSHLPGLLQGLILRLTAFCPGSVVKKVDKVNLFLTRRQSLKTRTESRVMACQTIAAGGGSEMPGVRWWPAPPTHCPQMCCLFGHGLSAL